MQQPMGKAADQTYSYTSANAQSGIAVNQAINDRIQMSSALPYSSNNDILETALNMPINKVVYVGSSNTPSHRPSTGMGYCSYVFFKVRVNDSWHIVTILAIEESKFACTKITINPSTPPTTIAWHEL